MFPWFSAMMLGLESAHVAGLRMMKLASGGAGAGHEALLMVTEKMEAAVEAATTILHGENPSVVVDRYREHVAANASRLSAYH